MRSEQKLSLIVFIVGLFIAGSVGYFQHGGFFSISGKVSAYKTIHFKSVEDINSFFQHHNFSIEAWRQGTQKIPWLIITDIPSQWGKNIAPSLTVDQKKDVFFKVALPLIFVANDRVKTDREILLKLMLQKPDPVRENKWIKQKALEYRVMNRESGRLLLDELKLKMDNIPPSLAIAQMIEESGWGTSRFAAEGNALFGQWSYEGGLKPQMQRAEKGDYRIMAFETPLASVQAYMRNLNSNPVYEEFRAKRAKLREKGAPVSGEELVYTLSKYSERGSDYIQTLRSIISKNQLSAMDSALLDRGDKYFLTPIFHWCRIGRRQAPRLFTKPF